jgi:ribosomal protein S6
MNKYELMILVKSQSHQEEKEAVFKQSTEAVTKCGGKIVNSQIWLDKQKLTYTINKCKEATFYLIKFEAAGSAIEKIKEIVRLNEDIVRFAFARME